MCFNKILDYLNEKGKFREHWESIKHAIALMEKYINAQKLNLIRQKELSKRNSFLRRSIAKEIKEETKEEDKKIKGTHEDIVLYDLLLHFKSLLKTKVEVKDPLKKCFKRMSIL